MFQSVLMIDVDEWPFNLGRMILDGTALSTGLRVFSRLNPPHFPIPFLKLDPHRVFLNIIHTSFIQQSPDSPAIS